MRSSHGGFYDIFMTLRALARCGKR